MTRSALQVVNSDALVNFTAPRRQRAVSGYRMLLAPAFIVLALCAVNCGGGGPSTSTSAGALVSQGLREESSGHLQQSIQDFIAATAKDHKDASAYYQLGVLYQQRLNKLIQAGVEYKHALSYKPNDTAAMYNLAVLDTLASPQAAQNLYARLLILEPKNPKVNFNLGLLLIAENQPVPGHAYLQKGISLDPSLAKQVPAGITP